MIAIPAGFSPEDYLALERDNTVRHEYRRGLVYAMAGGSDDHSRLCINFITAINLHLREGDCQFFSADVKVNYADAFFYYPDAFVTCDLRDREDRYVKRYPKLIAEVLSPSTENFERAENFEDYQQLESLEEQDSLGMCLEVLHERAVGFRELGVIREGGGQPCRTETLGHGWYAIDSRSN